jgi:hypothetical protein
VLLLVNRFTNGLPHDDPGEVDHDAYCALLRGDVADGCMALLAGPRRARERAGAGEPWGQELATCCCEALGIFARKARAGP